MERLARALATSGGAGYSPIAPGTMGTLVTIPVAWLLATTALLPYLAVVVAVTVIGIWAAAVADRSWQTHDSGRIVIDETAGYLLTMAVVDRGDLLTLLVGFVVFRALDIIKPPPIRSIDRHVGGGTGVMLDDVAAGVMGCGIMYAMAHYEILAKLHSLI